MSGYSNGLQVTYLFAAFAGISSAGQSSEKINGPAGRTGRLVSMHGVYTTGNTGAAGNVTLRNNVTTTELYGSVVAPVGAIETGFNGVVIDDVSDNPTDVGRIPEDAVLELDGDGGGTGGVADIWVTIEWS